MRDPRCQFVRATSRLELVKALLGGMGPWVAVGLLASAVLLAGVACGSSGRVDTVGAIERCVDRQTPAIRDPFFRHRARHDVRTFCAFAAGETGVLSQNGSVSEADEKRILKSHPEVVSDICALAIVFHKLPTDPKVLRQKERAIEAEEKRVCAIFLRHLH